ncbi:MAG: DUF86 domain-containing protein [Methanoculleus sp.]|nr:DUF86 domain-containing protein [Methanoculleus sp.]
MVSYDEEKVTTLSSELMQACERLRELGRLPREVFTQDPHLVASAKYHLIIGIEAAIDLANHVITKNRWKIPENYADTFCILEEHGFFDKNLGTRLQTMARFRNRLIHIYWDIDNDRIYNLLQEDIGDIEQYLTEYIRALQRE